MPALSVETLLPILSRHPAPRYWIAYSGGLDSHVLLHLCARLRDKLKVEFKAAHINHSLQVKADDWSQHCTEVCRDLGLPCLTLKVDAHAKAGESPEEAARLARYSALRQLLEPGEAMLTAQHRDDQAETLLLQLMRGAGLAGLSAMAEASPLEPGILIRPLLGFSRRELHDYAKAHSLRWIEDPSNQDSAYDRNFLRNEIIPRLARRWPGMDKALTRTAWLCAEAQQQLGDLAADLCRSALNPDGQTLSVGRLLAFNPADQRLVLREWMRNRGFRMPSQAVIMRIQQEVLPARSDKTPLVAWREGELRRYRDNLYLLPPLPAVDASLALDWDGLVPLELPDGYSRISATPTRLAGIALEHWRMGNIQIRLRQGGELCQLPGRAGTHELKKLFQEKGIPPWLRERAPLVYINGELAAVADWWVCEPFVGRAGGENVALAMTWKLGPISCTIPTTDSGGRHVKP